MRTREVHGQTVLSVYPGNDVANDCGADGWQSRKQGNATRIDSLRSKTHRVVRAVAQEHLVEKGAHVRWSQSRPSLN